MIVFAIPQQPMIVNALCVALSDTLFHGTGTRELTATALVDSVAPQFTDVPWDVIRVFADKVLDLFLSPVDQSEIDREIKRVEMLALYFDDDTPLSNERYVGSWLVPKAGPNA
jgi:hypothetical protein